METSGSTHSKYLRVINGEEEQEDLLPDHFFHHSSFIAPLSLSRWSYLLRSSRSTQPSWGNSRSHRLCRCTPNILFNAWSRPPFSSRPCPSTHLPSARSGVNGSGTLLSTLQARGSLKQNGMILNGGMDSARRRRQRRRYRIAPQSVDGERGGDDIDMRWKASQR